MGIKFDMSEQENKHLLRETKFENFKFFSYINDWMGLDIINGKIWEPHIVNFIKYNFKNTSTFIDIGSNYGWHSVIAAQICKKVYSFEPQKYIFNVLNKNIEINDLDNVQTFNLGVGNVNCEMEMNQIDYNVESLNIGDLGIGTGGEKISVVQMDSLEFDNVDFIKIDVQGFEKFVIMGAENTILKYFPTMIVEFEDWHLSKFSYNSIDLFEYLKSLGYEFFLLDYHYPSDHICVHTNKLSEFIIQNEKFIFNLSDKNNINQNVSFGVNKKLKYN